MMDRKGQVLDLVDTFRRVQEDPRRLRAAYGPEDADVMEEEELFGWTCETRQLLRVNGVVR